MTTCLNETVSSKNSFLRDYQYDAVDRMFNGCILNGGVGSGKSRASLYYYFTQQGGSIEPDYIPMKNPKDLYIITTARKRDTLEWEEEFGPFLITTNPEVSMYKHKVVVDSWNNIQKYKDITDAFFIFDEQRVVGYGAWSKAFIHIAHANDWILLSATPGDTWSDYIPVFIANRFYKSKKEFEREHIVWSRYTKFPQIDRYINTGRLIRLRNKILIDMDFERQTIQHHEDVHCRYDISTYKFAGKYRQNPFVYYYIPCDKDDEDGLLVGVDILCGDVAPIMEGCDYIPKDGDYVKLLHEPITNASGLCYIWRKILLEI